MTKGNTIRESALIKTLVFPATIRHQSLINIFTAAEPESDELAKSVWLLVSLLQLVLE